MNAARKLMTSCTELWKHHWHNVTTSQFRLVEETQAPLANHEPAFAPPLPRSTSAPALTRCPRSANND